jgi:2-polyprenyl-3-methyl-5-hydroxy-6-metoxy-1,4-benzoquinol methylase
VNSTPASLASSAAKRHWQAAYAAKGAHDVSWFQPEPEVSLELIERLRLGADAAILDVGGGASSLAARLSSRGFVDITVLDISGEALDLARAEFSTETSRVTWIEQDLFSWSPQRRYDLWHDRALFHFLVAASDVERYTQTLRSAISPGGKAIIGTFAADGPQSCSGLPVTRYGPDQLAGTFGGGFATIATSREEHRTPSGSLQPFTWVALAQRA